MVNERKVKKAKHQKVKGWVISAIAITCLLCGVFMLVFELKSENTQEKETDDLLTTYTGNIWGYIVVAALDAFIRAFVSVELFITLKNYWKL